MTTTIAPAPVMSKSFAVKLLNSTYPKLTARLKDGEIRVTERLRDQVRAEELAYYTEDASDALGTAFRWKYQGKPKPTAEQLETLSKFAAQNGRYWKTALRGCWMSGNYRNHCFPGGGDPALLQQIRNSFGPSWLAGFDLRSYARCTGESL